VPLDDIDVPRIAEHQQYLLTHPRAAVEGERGSRRRRSAAPTRCGASSRTSAASCRSRPSTASSPATPRAPCARSRSRASRPSGRSPRSSLRRRSPPSPAATGSSALLLGHCGLRPVEAQLVPWGELRENTITIRADLTKATAAYARTITVPAETLRELRRWRLECGVPGDDQPIIGPSASSYLHSWGAGEAQADRQGGDRAQRRRDALPAAPHARLAAALLRLHAPERCGAHGARGDRAPDHLRARGQGARGKPRATPTWTR
jgi:hypothetical protein